MTATMKVVCFVLGASGAIGLGFIPLIHDPRPAAAAHQETERIEREMLAESNAAYRRAYVKHVYLTLGDADGNLYVRCTTEPPQQPVNQKRCQAVLDRLQKEDNAEAAREAKAKAKANW